MSQMSVIKTINEVYKRLRACYGHQHWWPGETPFEVAVGAVLTQNTTWKNVEKAIAALKAATALDHKAIMAMSYEQLAMLIKPAGYFNVKARRLKALVSFLTSECNGDPLVLASLGLEKARRMLLQVHGIGRETADSILLYASGMPIFVVDAYTRRVFGRIGILDPTADYDHIRALFESALPLDVDLYNDYHAQIVVHGKEVCRKRPYCDRCVISSLCGRKL